MATHRGRGARRRRSALRSGAHGSRPVKRTQQSADLVAVLEQRREARAGGELAVSGSTTLTLGDRDAKWDATAAEKAVREWSGATEKPNAQYAKAFFLERGDGENFDDYGLGFAEPVDGKLQANWGGITAVAGALSGARGGVKDVADSDIAEIKTKVADYYAKAAKKYGYDSLKAPWEAVAEASIAFALEHGLDIFYANGEDGTEVYAGMGGDFNPVELVDVQKRAAAHALAYAQLGPDADESLLEMAAALWLDELAAPETITAAVGDVAWAPEDGFRDLICDVNDALAEMDLPRGDGDEYGYMPHVVDAAIRLDKVLIGCGDGDYYVAPITVGDDNEPIVSDPSEWVPVEKGMIEVAPETPDGDAAMRTGIAQLAGIGRLVFAAVADEVEATLPEAHQPGSRMPARNPSPRTPAAPAASTAAPEGPTAWSAILAPEGKLTSDGRAFAPGSITWRELPLTLMAMIETSEGGHVGAQVAGRVDDIWRDDAAGLIRGKGVFDTGEYGSEISRLVGDETLRGNSVDLAIGDYITGPRSDWFDEDGNWIGELDNDGKWQPANGGSAVGQSILDVYNEDTIAVVLSAEIGMTTVCPFPAFGVAKIAVGDSLVAGANPAFWTVTQQGGWTVEECTQCTETVVAAAVESEQSEFVPNILSDDGENWRVANYLNAEDVRFTGTYEECVEHLRQYASVSESSSGDALTAAAAGLVPERPPAEWFENPNFAEPTAITVDDDGRISGHAAAWGVCHIGFPSVCRTAPHSKTDYAYFHLGEIVVEDGSRIACGQITLDAPHADLRLGRSAATSHYDHTGTVVAHVRCGEDEHGIWVAGALQPDAPADKVRLLRGSKLSGDWRDGELVALLAVNVPGFPVPRQQALAACGADGDQVLALVAAGIPVFEAELSEDELERFSELRELAQAS